MSYVSDLTYFEIKARIKFLEDAKEIVHNYFSDLDYGSYSHEPVEGEVATTLRPRINRIINKLSTYLLNSGTHTTIYYLPPPAIGGLAGNIDFLANIFQLASYHIPPSQVTDAIERAQSKYGDELFKSKIRTFNPLWWFSRLIKYIARLPFVILNEVGISTSKFEVTIFGRLVSLMFNITTFLASVAGILTMFGVQDELANYLRNLL